MEVPPGPPVMSTMVAEIYGSSSHEIILMQGEAVLGLEAAARSLSSSPAGIMARHRR